MRIAIDSHVDDSSQSSREKVPTIPVSVNPVSIPIKGSLAYDTITDSIWYGTGSNWLPVGAEEGVRSITSIASTGGTIGITATPNPITSIGTLALADIETVTPGTYTRANLNVDQQGRLTFAENGPAIPPAIFGYAVDSNDITIPYNSDFTFNKGAIINTGFTSAPVAGSPGGTAFVIATAGLYEIDFDIVSYGLVPLNKAQLIVGLYVNNAPTTNPPAQNFTFLSKTTSPLNSNQEFEWIGCHGNGMLELAVNDSITLRNLSATDLATCDVRLQSLTRWDVPVATCSWTVRRIGTV